MGWITKGSIPGRSKETIFSLPLHPDQLWAPPASYSMGTRDSFPKDKAVKE